MAEMCCSLKNGLCQDIYHPWSRCKQIVMRCDSVTSLPMIKSHLNGTKFRKPARHSPEKIICNLRDPIDLYELVTISLSNVYDF